MGHYDKLKTEITVLGRDTEEWSVLEEEVKNTHAATHTQYSLQIEEIFKVSRKGEAKRFKPFKALPNRKLLWHGSRTTNFAGILSQGLRIAPPEVPVGVGVKDSNLKTDLLYNEFIVYDTAQVNAKYLFRMKFNYKI